ncbi:MAG: AAA family ATPase [Atopobiaceae bacterium]|jgi:5-methylcytosine-specific restriction protein B|nr:AAA family ATPase [Atopobiaceae bacterium]MCI2173000.1 AAA family ATPase [Atopobiaceae bacterium]MCI2208092.1 AAA family ATPase [Atopobiaceae bacterium]
MNVEDEYYWTEYFPALAQKLREYKDNGGDLVSLTERAREKAGLEQRSEDLPAEIDPLSIIRMGLRSRREPFFSAIGETAGLGLDAPRGYPGIPSFRGDLMPFDPKIMRASDAEERLWSLFVASAELADGMTSDGVDERFDECYQRIISDEYKGLTAAGATDLIYLVRPLYFVPMDSPMCSFEGKSLGIFLKHQEFGITRKDIRAAERTGFAYRALCKKVRDSISSGQIPYATIPELSNAAWESRAAGQKATVPDAVEHEGEDAEMTNCAYRLNTILYGPPGTGKTYETTRMALGIIDGWPSGEPLDEKSFKRYRDLVKEGRIGFVTFHQSFSYEDFVEGLRPITSDDDPEDSTAASGSISYSVEDGVFKAFCDRAHNASVTEGLKLAPDARVWKVSLNGTGRNPIRTDCLENGRIRIGFDDLEPEGGTIPEGTGHTVVNTFWNRMSKGDVICSCWSEDEVDAIGIVESEARYDEALDSFCHVRDVTWLKTYKGSDKLSLRDLNGGKRMTLSSVYELSRVQPRDLFDAAGIDVAGAAPAEDLPYVFIIDEINRGNVSAILGELITLVEEDKRLGASQERTVELPYSREHWGVPGNVHIIATMNTADRSLAQLDTALRRRFSFREMAPDSSVITGREDKGIVEGVNLASLLDAMNKRIRALYDRDHAIGHSVLLGVESLDDLRDAFAEGVIPLLEEYFFDDPVKMRIVLNDSDGDFIAIDEQPSAASLGLSGFNDVDLGAETTPSFEVRPRDKWAPETFERIYLNPSAKG